MFRLLRWGFSLLMLASFIWVAAMVPLGRRTLAQHVRAIFATPEAQELVDGTKQEVEKVKERLRNSAAQKNEGKSEKNDKGDAQGDKTGADKAGANSSYKVVDRGDKKPLENTTAAERAQLDKLVREKTGLAHAPTRTRSQTGKP